MCWDILCGLQAQQLLVWKLDHLSDGIKKLTNLHSRISPTSQQATPTKATFEVKGRFNWEI